MLLYCFCRNTGVQSPLAAKSLGGLRKDDGGKETVSCAVEPYFYNIIKLSQKGHFCVCEGGGEYFLQFDDTLDRRLKHLGPFITGVVGLEKETFYLILPT